MIAASPLRLSRSGILTMEHSHALSAEAESLSRCTADVRRHFEGGLSLRRVATHALAELEAARTDAAEPNWDGYGARPMHQDAYAYAERFIRSLPTTVPIPEVGADPDGEVSIDWDFGPRRVLSVSVGPSGRLAYAALIGPSKMRGTEWFADAAPSQILDVLSRLIRTL
jgi:hypothetical protein